MKLRRRTPEPGEWTVPIRPHPVDAVEAADIAIREISRAWPDRYGEVMLDPAGPSHNDDVFVFDYGAREFLVGGDSSKALAGYALCIVRRADGAFIWYLPGPPPLSDFDEKFPDLRR